MLAVELAEAKSELFEVLLVPCEFVYELEDAGRE